MKAERIKTPKNFLRDENGAVTVLSLFLTATSLAMFGLALDQANAWRVKTQMQIATDAGALAGAANLSDPTLAQALALQTANMNLDSDQVIQAQDVHMGYIDPDTLEFVSGVDPDGSYSAVKVDSARNAERDNQLPTYLLKLAGISSFDIDTSSVAAAQVGVNGGGFSGCEDAMFLSTKQVQTGGGNTMNGAVCIHGSHVSTGGGDYYNPEVRMSAPSLSNIYLASYSPSTLKEETIKVARTMEPVLLSQLTGWRNAIFTDLWKSRSANPSLWEQPLAPWGGRQWYYVGKYTINKSNYSGVIPDFVFDSAGQAKVVMRDTYWTIQPGELAPHTIYLSEQGIQFAGGVQAEDIAVVTKGDIGVGGGNKLYFDDVFFLGTQLNFSGAVEWGKQIDVCSDYAYNVYAFGTQSLSLGGWPSGSTVNGMVGAAPSFSPGGGMTGTGVYFESNSYLTLGGSMKLTGCGTMRESELALADFTFAEPAQSSGSYLYR